MLTQRQNIPGVGSITSSPHTDLRNCGVGMLEAAIGQLEAHHAADPALFAAWVAAHGGTVTQLVEGMHALCVALTRTLEDPDVDFQLALVDVGFTGLPRGLQDLIAAKLGRIALGTVIYACRDSSIVGEPTPYRELLDGLLARASGLAMKIAPVTP